MEDSLAKIEALSVQLATVNVAEVDDVGVPDARVTEGAAGGEESIVNAEDVIDCEFPTASVASSLSFAVTTLSVGTVQLYEVFVADRAVTLENVVPSAAY